MRNILFLLCLRYIFVIKNESQNMNLVKNSEFIDMVLPTLKRVNSLSNISEKNRQSLKGIVSYLSKLRNDKVIDDASFFELLLIACSNFIENEVEIRISKSFSDRLLFLFEKK